MERTTVINSLGTVVLKDISLGDGQIEVHVPIECVSDSLEKVLDNCMEDFKSKHTTESDNDINFDVRVVFSCGDFRTSKKNEAEFTLLIITWNGSATEFYDDIPVSFDKEDSKKIKEIIWNELRKTLFNI